MKWIQFILVLVFFIFNLLYSQTSIDLFKKASEISDWHDVNGKFTFDESAPQKRINLLKKCIELEKNFIEAHLFLGKEYGIRINNNSYDGKKSKYHFDECLRLLKSGAEIKGIEFYTKRTIYADIAWYYPSENSSDKYLKKIDLYKEAMEYPYEKKQDRYADDVFLSCSDESIKKRISQYYRDLAGLSKCENDLSTSVWYLETAYRLAVEIDDDYWINQFKQDIRTLNVLVFNENWTSFIISFGCNSNDVIGATPPINELVSSTGFMYLYNPKSIEHITKETIRVWLLLVNINEPKSVEIQQKKTLVEFDNKRNRYRTLSHITYNSSNETLNNYSNENSDWEYIVPDSIYEEIMKYLFSTKKNKKK